MTLLWENTLVKISKISKSQQQRISLYSKQIEGCASTASCNESKINHDPATEFSCLLVPRFSH